MGVGRGLNSPAGALVVAAAYGAGLATGLARFPDPLSVAAAGLAALWLSRIAAVRVGAVALLLGLAVAFPARWWAARSCAARLPRGALTLDLTPVDPGAGLGRVRPRGRSCHGEVTARWPLGGVVPAGVTVTVAARWRSRVRALGRPDGVLEVLRVSVPRGRPGLIAATRNAVATRSARLFGDQAALVDALVAGRRGGLADDLVDSFAQSGLVHLLVISGSHVALVAGWAVLLVVLIGLPRRWGLWVGACVAVGYSAWLGWPAPATRAGVLIAVMTCGRLLQRRWRPGGALGCSAVVVLVIDPWAIGQIGAWLSFVAVAGVTVASRWSRRAWTTPSEFRDTVAASIGATLTTAPLAAWSFGRVAAIGVVLNLAAVPLAAITVPALGGALLLDGVLPEMARAFATTGGLLLEALVWLGRWGSTLPGAAGYGEGGARAALPWLGLLAMGWLVIRGGATPREAGRRLWWSGSVLGLVALAWPSPTPFAPRGQLAFAFLDVGQGDATVIRTPAGHWMLVDAGPADGRYDAGARVVVPFLRRSGVRELELLVISHAHRDHTGGAAAVEAAVPVRLVIDPGEPVADSAYQRLLATAARGHTRWQIVAAGDSFVVDGVRFRVVHPATGWWGAGRDLNEDSIVLEVRWREFTALLAGDAGIAAESSYVARVAPIDLLKVGHHGSRTATGSTLLSRRPPDAAVISLGTNRYGHPAPETLARLAAHDVAVWRTDREGPVTVTTDGHTFTVRGERSTRTFDATDP